MPAFDSSGPFSIIACAQEGEIHETLNAITGHITASVPLRCLWADRLLLADDILINRRNYPLVTTAFSPIALNCSIVKGDNDYNAVTTGQWRPPLTAIVTVNYGVPDTASSATYDMVAESLEPMGEFRRLPHAMFRWGSQTGLAVLPDESPGFLEIKLRLVRRIYRLNSIPPAALTLFGCVNDATYVSPTLGFTFGPETLLYDAPQPEMTISSDGSQGFNMTQNFVFSPMGWNKYFNPLTATWDYMYHVASSVPYKSYTPASFAGIL